MSEEEIKEILEDYTKFLMKWNYTDTDVIFEEPKAVDRYLESIKK